MPESITTAMVQQYSANVLSLAQQTYSKFRGKISWEKIQAEGAYFERIGRVEAEQNNTRFGDTPTHDIQHTRRHVTQTEWIINLPLDLADAAQILIDPKSRYAAAAAAGMARKMDSLVCVASVGTAQTGKDGTGSETWPQNNALGHSMQIAHGGVGLTLGKLTNAKRLLDEGEVEEEDRWVAFTAQALEDLLNTDALTTWDRMEGRAIQSGKFPNSWLGFTWFPCERLVKSGTTRSLLAFQAQALGVKYAIDMNVRAGERADKNYSWQTWHQMVMGAVRIDAERLVEIQITEEA